MRGWYMFHLKANKIYCKMFQEPREASPEIKSNFMMKLITKLENTKFIIGRILIS